ncbi:MAG: 2-dehydro-3-deoxy-6-phosphogalactonate aldolase [Burkholderiales bacterium]|nr:MAG: 2-dehydro-3-deoxy-6-phosphogalactonate aldolase [Burkholderiales bacterium]
MVSSEAWRRLMALPVIAILRGIHPHEVAPVADVLGLAGMQTMEVPLNSPSAVESIHLLCQRGPHLVGAGTVLTAGQVDEVADAGGQLILSPNMNPAVIARTVERGLISIPGVATMTEAFAALEAGAHALKLFPADTLGLSTIKAWRAVLPSHAKLICVGGVTEHNLGNYRQAGADGVGLGSSLYTPGVSTASLHRKAKAAIQAWGTAHSTAQHAPMPDLAMEFES